MSRSSLQTLAALALVALFAAPVAAATPGGTTTATLRGTLEAVWVEDVEHGRGRLEFALRTGREVVELRFDHDRPEGLGGAEVTVSGARAGKALRVASLRVRRLPPPGTLAALDGATGTSGAGDAGVTTTSSANTESTAGVAKSFAVILVNFSNDTRRPWTPSTVTAAIAGSSGSVKAFYEEESKGRLSISGKAFGWYTLPTTNSTCDWRSWHTMAIAAATDAGVDLSGYSNVVFLWPHTDNCGFSGLGYMPGSYAYLNGTISVQVMTHEVGHNLGIHHANGYECTSGGVRVTISGSCTTASYADPFSTMGNRAARHNHGSHLGELGWLSADEVVIGSPGETYTLTPYFASGGTKLVRIPRGDGTFFDLDVRMSHGAFDDFAAGSAAVNGVMIRLGAGTASPTRSPVATLLLDATPATKSLDDAPLVAGATITDPVSKISLTTLSIDGSAARVRVREGIAPSAPSSLEAVASDAPSVALSWGGATDNVGVAAYRVTRNGTTVVTTDDSTTGWTDTGVVSGTDYAYAVRAIDGSGNAGPAATADVRTPGTPPATAADPDPTPNPDDTEPPTAPVPLDATPAVTRVTLDWAASSDDIAVAGYAIARNGTHVATTSDTTWTDAGRKPATTYAYSVVALDGAGNASPAATVSSRTLPDTVRPSTPRNLRKVRRNGAYVVFRWRASTDNVRVLKYRIYRVGRAKPIASTTRTRIRIRTVAGARYYVRAVDTSHNRSYRSNRVRGR